MFKLQDRKSACTTCAASSEILRWLTLFFPNIDPKWDPELDHIFIPSFRSLFWAPFGDPDLDPKVGPAIGEVCCCPQRFCEADLRRTSMSVSVNTCFLSLCVPLVSCTVQSRSLSGRHVSTSFLDPVLGAMMKQVCWHSRPQGLRKPA